MNRLPALALVLVLAVPLAAAPGAAKYWPFELHRMVAAADLVVVGRIAEVDAKTFRLDVEDLLAGETGQWPGERLEVVRFQDWPCAQRWTPYATGQRVLLFLQRHEDEQGHRSWRILSGGGEGEMPVYDVPRPEEPGSEPARLVVLRGSELPSGGSERVELDDGSHVSGWVLPLGSVAADLRAWRASFRTAKWPLFRTEGPPRIETDQTRAELDALKSSDRLLLAWLARQLAPHVVHGEEATDD